MKVLNLYACLGGNRYKWDEVQEVEVVAVENDPYLAEMYQERFPKDIVIVGDAHDFLLNNFKDFDFIWSSPNCPTHSKSRFARRETTTPQFPDMNLYQEIIFLDNYFDGKYCVENVVPFYEPLIPAKKRGRHLYWTNFNLPNVLSERISNFMENENEVEKFCEFHEIDLSKYKGNQRKDKIARNLVDFEAGKTIFQSACGIMNKKESKQTSLFEF
jgi:DNA (cytosine-5)-methyltransferase 1